MAHRIRECVRVRALSRWGSVEDVVEADEVAGCRFRAGAEIQNESTRKEKNHATLELFECFRYLMSMGDKPRGPRYAGRNKGSADAEPLFFQSKQLYLMRRFPRSLGASVASISRPASMSRVYGR